MTSELGVYPDFIAFPELFSKSRKNGRWDGKVLNTRVESVYSNFRRYSTVLKRASRVGTRVLQAMARGPMRKRLLGLTCAAVLMLLGSTRLLADQITNLGTWSGSGTDTLNGSDTPPGSLKGVQSTVSASATFFYDSTTKQLILQLSNTTTQSQLMGHDDAVTEMAFSLNTGLSLSNGQASGKTATFNTSPAPGTFTPSSTATNLNADWGGGPLVAVPNTNSEPAFKPLVQDNDNYAVTSFTDELLTTGNKSYTSFSGSSLGVNYSLIPAVSAPADSDNFIGFSPYTYGTVTIGFSVNGPVTASDISGINFLFGTWDPPAVISATAYTPPVNPNLATPEPSSLSLGLFAVVVGGTWLRVRRREPLVAPKRLF
jgi:hypothetical protein